MKAGLAACTFAGVLALAGSTKAQTPSPSPSPVTDSGATCTQDNVKTWTTAVNGKEWGVRPATPGYEGDTGLFHMSTAYTLFKGKWAFSAFRDNLDRDPKDLDVSIHGFSLAYGATDRLEVFGNFGLQNRIDADALFQTGFANDYPFVGTPWETGFGDIKLGLKYKFLDDYLGDGVGLAVRGVVKLPTADEGKGLGTGKTQFAGDLVLSKTLAKKADLHASIGYELNSDPDGIDIGNAFRWGFGLNIPACRALQLQAEIQGKSYSGADVDQTKPLDVVIGPVLWIKPGFFIRPAISWNVNFDDRGLGSSSKTYTGRHISIGYHPGTHCCEIYVPPPPPPPPVNRNPTVSCEVERSTLFPGETVRCHATASDPDGDRLTYTWSATAGRVTGSGADATFDSGGVAPGTRVTITVTVSDGRGGTASSNCPVSVQAHDQPKPQPVTCTSGGFPRNMARLNNMDKACLDDVASRLRQDPRGRVVVTGHADSSERYPEVIARKRAEAIKDYLVKERGVDASRITARSAGASKPLDTGTSAAARARNRRVDVTFVPEGATLPE